MPGKVAPTGYSGTPLIQKLGVPATSVFVINPPCPYGTLLGSPFDAITLSTNEPLPQGAQFLHLFTTLRAEMETVLTMARPRLDPKGMIWVSWPKKAAKVPTDITEDTIREVCLPLGLVDVKVCAVDAVWSGLKLMVRKSLR